MWGISRLIKEIHLFALGSEVLKRCMEASFIHSVFYTWVMVRGK